MDKEQLDVTGENGFSRQVAVRAGNLNAILEPSTGVLRYVKLGSLEVIRGIYIAVRDESWGTIPVQIDKMEIQESYEGFDVTMAVSCVPSHIDFVWQASIVGNADDIICYSMEGKAGNSFLRNRIGFCLLHPIQCAGTACELEFDGGGVSLSRFPTTISPHQPFKGLRGINYHVARDCMIKAKFEGDVFETEDQRNWSDASFKTYCTPLDRPWPVRVEPGEKVRQSVELRISGPAPERVFELKEAGIDISVSDDTVELPRVGLCNPADNEVPSDLEAQRLRALKLDHLRIQLTPAQESVDEVIRSATDTSSRLETPLEIALFLGPASDRELSKVAEVIRRRGPSVARWLVLDSATTVTPEGLVPLARRYLARHTPNAIFGAGTDLFFAELNRKRPAMDGADFVAYSLNPQVHTFDNASIVETLEAQSQTATDARLISQDRAVSVTPVTLKPRKALSATAASGKKGSGPVPESDPRQNTLFAAAWLVVSINQFGKGGADTVSYFETTGPGGVMQRGHRTSVAGGRASNDIVFPIYHVLADITEFETTQALRSSSSEPLKVDCIILKTKDRIRFLIVNLTTDSQTVTVRFSRLSGVMTVKILGRDNVLWAMSDPEAFRAAEGSSIETSNEHFSLILDALSIARIDGELQ